MAGFFEASWLEELRSRVSLEDIVSQHVALKRNGRRLWGLCPFHGEKTSSFSVDMDKQIFYCFGCHKGGDVFGFVMEMERMEFVEAVESLAERAHMELPARNGHTQVNNSLKQRVYLANVCAARYYHDQLFQRQNTDILAYFHSRGLTDATVKKFGLGAAGQNWDDLTHHMMLQGFTKEEIVSSGLAREKEGRIYDVFRSRALFPIINARDQVVGFGARALGDDMPKYLNTSDTIAFNKRQGLYGLNFVKRERNLDSLVLVEGYMDVISLVQHGVRGVVATLGTALTPEQARLMKRFAPEVLIAYDGDDAGRKAILRAIEIIEKEGLPCRIYSFAQGMDPDEYIKKEGLAGFTTLLKMSAISYRMEQAALGYDLLSAEGRTQYAIAAAGILREVKNPVELEGYVQRLSVETGFTRDVLIAQIGKLPTPAVAAVATRSHRKDANSRPQHEKAERQLLSALAEGHLQEGLLQETDFEDAFHKKLAASLLAGQSPAGVLSQLEDEKERAKAAEIFASEMHCSEEHLQSLVNQTLQTLRRHRMQEEIPRLQEMLKTAPEDEKSQIAKRLMEIVSLQKNVR